MATEVELEALTMDAARWRHVAGELGKVGKFVPELAFHQTVLTSLGALIVGPAYRDLCAHVAALVDEGSLKLELGADELDMVRGAYEDTDASAQADLIGIWETED